VHGSLPSWVLPGDGDVAAWVEGDVKAVLSGYTADG